MKTNSLVSALALVLALLSFGFFQPLQASPLIDPASRGTLTIIQHTGDPLTQFGDPSNPIADGNREPIPGVVFAIQKIESIDLRTNEGWLQAQSLNIEDFYAGGPRTHELGSSRESTTDEHGRAVFTDLELGAYYVTELPSAVQQRGNIAARPFVVTIPQTTQDGTAWNYDVVVNAKNQLLKVTLQAGKTCFRPGDPIDFGVSATVPPVDATGGLSRYELYVPFNETFTQPVNNRVIITRTGEPTDLNSPDAIELAHDDFEVTFNDNVAHLVLKESGLQKLANVRDGNPAAQVTWLFESSTNQEDPFTTKAYLLVDGYPEFDSSQRYGVVSNEVTLHTCDEPIDVEIPVPVPAPGYDEVLFPGTSVPAQPAPSTENVAASKPSKGFVDRLAFTGADVLWLLGVGIVLILVGVALRRKNTSQN